MDGTALAPVSLQPPVWGQLLIAMCSCKEASGAAPSGLLEATALHMGSGPRRERGGPRAAGRRLSREGARRWLWGGKPGMGQQRGDPGGVGSGGRAGGGSIWGVGVPGRLSPRRQGWREAWRCARAPAAAVSRWSALPCRAWLGLQTSSHCPSGAGGAARSPEVWGSGCHVA